MTVFLERQKTATIFVTIFALQLWSDIFSLKYTQMRTHMFTRAFLFVHLPVLRLVTKELGI